MSIAPSSAGNFVHLHNHTEYSMLDGAARITDMFERAAELGMPAIATTDHGYIFGAHEFWSAGNKTGVKPIIGLEAYVTPGTHRSDRTRVKYGDGGRDDVSGSGAYTHMTMWARNNNGLHNLFRMASLASLEGYYFKPRMDRELLETYGKGIIATTGCPSGEVQTRLRFGQYAEARQAAAEMQDIFGKENYFLELMDHGIDIERRTRADLLKLAKDLDLPLVATNDLHYTRKEDAQSHSALLCIQTAATLQDPTRFKFDGDGYYLKSAQEMREIWRELPEACDNTLLIAERCEVSFTEGEGRFMPRFPVPEGEDETSWFVKEVETGLHRRYPEGVPDYARKQAEYETGVILGKGYPGYFLVVADFINWAKNQGIRVGPGRGSGAGSMCAYAMGITDLDPIPHGLIFERFLNPERMSMPDFDVDFDDRRRSEVIHYVTEKYGDDRVAMIATYGTLKAKAALKDAARVMGFPFAMGERLTKAMPPSVMGKDIPLSGIHDTEHPRYGEAGEFRELLANDPEAAQVFETATGLEGLKRQWGVHAAGVIMSSEPLIDVIPIMRREQDGQIITQFDYPTCERLGLVKMDFLGLRNLTILDDAIANVKLNRGEDLDLDALSKDMTDPKAYELLGRGDTLGVFQLDGSGMRQLLRLMQPDNFEDISAALALYRPGPMGVNAHTNFALRKNNKQEVVPLDPQLKGKLQPEMVEALEPILGTTYGLCVAGDTLIVDADSGERVRIDGLSERVTSGFFTFGVDQEGRVVRRRVTHWWEMPAKPVLTVQTASGQQLRLSTDHKVLTPRGWVPAGELIAGKDRLARPRDASEFSTPSQMSGDEAALLGYLLSDGYITLYDNTFISASKTLRDHVGQLAEDLFDDTFAVEETPDRRAPRIRFAASPAGTGRGRSEGYGTYATIGINRWLRRLGFTGKTTSAHKFVPELAKQASLEVRVRLLAALWDGDGHVGSKLAYYKTVSRQLADDVAEVLSGAGIPCTVRWAGSYESVRFGPQTAWTVHVYDDRFWELVVPAMKQRAKVLERARRTSTAKSRGLNRELMLVHAGDALRRDSGLSTRTRNIIGNGPATVAGLHRHLHRAGLVRAPKMSFPRDGGDGWFPLNETARGYLEAIGTTEDRFYASMDWSLVTEITVGDSEPVYDITVEDVHNFISSGLVLSNCIYQEQVMEIAQKLAGYTLGNADLLRRAMGKKKKEVLDAEYVPFSDGMKANGYNEASVAALWGVLVPFSDYAFNKAHTAAYGVISYWTAFLKANYPAEYMAALLTSVRDDKDKTALYLNECRRMGIAVLPPDVNESIANFAAVGKDIRFGLAAIRNVGTNVVDAVVATRADKGNFTSFEDFLRKCPAVVCQKRTIESLIKGGAFDDLGHPRQGLVTVHERYVDALAEEKKQEAIGQDSLFGGFGGEESDVQIVTLPPVPDIEWEKQIKLAFEREYLGLYVSDHPLNGIEHILTANATATIGAVVSEDGPQDGEFVTVAGLMTSVQLKRTKNGDPYARVMLEDLVGSIECVFFPKSYMTVSTMLAPDTVAVIRGRFKRSEDTTEILAQDLTIPEIKEGPRGPVLVTLPLTRATDGLAHNLRKVLADHPGSTEVHVKLTQPGRQVLLRLDPTLRVTASPAFFGDIKALLGPAAVGS
ncbi:DNA polymerase III subunit alpha [Ornithinimicrobium cryptoxanthini]|uniref:DNA polymerase III subunit alpha n=1 Tax=Ornithinimicrobium cryptoxanthini TaxID=2934161 RepID=A0ABY4YL13_9MICO|nr:DNA polymerase III subunit alpha [Ornithinimicrobium cryptoxanthini]USQ77488.1 DNA polymerase III subunit alpha [Ornithinimicrobium cryptoxanthini]